ncbi:MAG: hypothetical protein RSC88_03995, partial [Oscillospiraceae bacterium]
YWDKDSLYLAKCDAAAKEESIQKREWGAQPFGGLRRACRPNSISAAHWHALAPPNVHILRSFFLIDAFPPHNDRLLYFVF